MILSSDLFRELQMSSSLLGSAQAPHWLGTNPDVLRLTTSFDSQLDPNSSSSASIIARQSQSITTTATTADLDAMSDLKCLEHPTLKVPYELLNKKFRGAQKNIDREVSHVQNAVVEMEKTVNAESTASVGDITELISGVVEKLAALKRKAKESFVDEIDAATVCKKRLDHLKEYCSNVGNETTARQWTKKRLDRMLVEHFLLCGYYDTAVKLALQADVVDYTNIDLFRVSRQVEASLAKKETASCLNWCHDNKSKLRKMKSSLEFNIRQQEFIELLRQKRRLEAIKHARKYFHTMEEKSTSQQSDMQHVMGLLAFKPDTQLEPYKSLFDESRWALLIEQFRHENFKLFQLTPTSVFSITLQCGLSALKTPHCYRKDGERNPDCPVCSDILNELAKPLPCAHRSQSRLVCAISGQPLNEHNQPLMLPNGNVYGEISLKEMALKNNGRIICPRTKQIYEMKDVEKVFVM